MKKELIIIFALCLAFSTVVNATANVEINMETEESTAVEQIIEPEFSLLVETVTQIGAEAEAEPEEIETQTDEIVTEIESETIGEIVTDVERDIIYDATEEVQPTDIEIVTENETFEEATEAVVEETETEAMTETAIEENSTEDETEAESEPSSMPIGEVTEAATMEVATEITTDIIEEDSEYVEAVVNSIVIGAEVTTEGEEIFIQIKGENLFNKCVNIKVRPTNTYKNFYYIRTIVLENDSNNMIRISLPEGSVGLYRVDVDVEKIARETKVIAIGESSDSELKCEANRKTAVITGQSKTSGEKAIMVKIVDDSGKIVYLRQLTTEANGSYTINATLPAESANYIVWITVEGESSGYVKTMTPFSPNDAKDDCTYTCSGSTGDYEDVLVFAKNIGDMEKYTYELDYSEYMDDVQLVDLCALTRAKEVERGFCENGNIEVISASNGKIRFVVNGIIEDGTLWSGLLNIIRFKRLSDNDVTFTLRIY